MIGVNMVARHACSFMLVGALTIAGYSVARAKESQPTTAAAEYNEALRPQFHFTAQKNWLNDPNGLVYFDGEYHLFFQHNPSGIEWGNMTWGHAVSPDLLHWRQLENALYPDEAGMMYSGSAVVDWQNTSGLQVGDKPPLIAFYTAAGGRTSETAGRKYTQNIAYSHDRGRTWTKYAHNPVLDHIIGTNRDPKVVWHEPSQRWIMALYLNKDRFGLFNSPDLKSWRHLCDVQVPQASECPDFFELPVAGTDETKWIFWAGDGTYLVGTFDGKKFVDESGPIKSEFGANSYAAQSFSDIPPEDGRRIQIAWMRNGKYPDMPFNQQMSLPTSITLESFSEGLRLRRNPVKELQSLRGPEHTWSGELKDDVNPCADIQHDTFELMLMITPNAADEISLSIHGTPIVYKPELRKLSVSASEAIVPDDGEDLKLHVFVDRASIEVFVNDGRLTLSECFVPPSEHDAIELQGAGAIVESLRWWPLKSIWREAR